MTDFLSELKQEFERVERKLAETTEQIVQLRRQAEEQIGALEERKGQLQARVRHIQALLALEGIKTTTAVSDTSLQESVGHTSQNESVALADAVYQLLLQTGKEFHYRQLVSALGEMGIVVPGRDPGINLVAHIHDDARFIRPKQGVYALREWYPVKMKSVGTRKRKSRKRRLAKARASRSSSQGELVRR